jgi:hypothetical protein
MLSVCLQWDAYLRLHVATSDEQHHSKGDAGASEPGGLVHATEPCQRTDLQKQIPPVRPWDNSDRISCCGKF